MNRTLRCPLCHDALTLGASAAHCPRGHSFDRAREGYFNLLPVQHKNSLDPGDDADMVAARRAFLEAGFYSRFRDTLAGLLAPLQPAHLIDSGCGEGWYTTALATTAQATTAFDISKNAIKRAAKRDAAITWLVASSNAIPLEEASADALVAIFSPLDTAEAARVLKPGAALLIAAPGEKHLWELREALYDEVRPHQAEKWQEELQRHFNFHSEARVQFTMNLPGNATVQQLLKMTPHYWRASREKRTQVEQLSSLVMQADFRILQFRRKA
ncbi:MAG: rRNA ((1)-)-methyltransferase [Moraxellaceae bacterium]|jgi:23S rRNA (guanine745-N1)-methyltransferase|nr:rRNA ((1)-)-methyltransferase [Moraxellaceae bacterium]